MAGRGRGRVRKKRAKIDAAPPSSSAAAAAEEEMPVAMDHAARSMMMSTSLGALLRIEATIWLNARGGGRGSMPLDDFYALARTHEWLGLNNQKDKVNDGTGDSNGAMVTVSKQVSMISLEVYELINKLSEEERLLLDILSVSAWEPTEITKLYPLYRLYSSEKGKIQLEVMQQPRPMTSLDKTTKAKNSKIATRSDVLGNMYHQSRKCFSFGSVAGSMPAIQKWWEHVKSTSQLILGHRESMADASMSKVTAESGTVESSANSIMAESKATVSPTKNGNGKNMTLEERVRARSMRKPSGVKQVSKIGGKSLNVDDNKGLLELADALRSYSQRRGIASSGVGRGGGSALDRLRNRGINDGTGSNNATRNIARLTVTDLIKDARTTWGVVVHESIDQRDGSSGSSKSRKGGSTPLVGIDLGRVLFQLRLRMVSVADMSDKRQMEMQLLGLLEKLATLAPEWIHLRKAPSTLAVTTKPPEKNSIGTKEASGISSKQQNAKTSSTTLNIRLSIIVIRNDCVDYANIRANLGGRVHNTKSSNDSKKESSNGNKRSFQDMTGQQPQNIVHQPVGAADAIVPPSFRRMYGKALGLDSVSKKK
mmetsp:Transcript_35619/g.75059  ORF Transcript_35619/g.75059 Transcript_35619/m.75059 type:complete len:596 (+) Transcript_35619:87-1874(+)